MPLIAAVEPSLSFAIYSGRNLKPGAKQLTTAFRIAFYLTAVEHLLQAHQRMVTSASSALRLTS